MYLNRQNLNAEGPAQNLSANLPRVWAASRGSGPRRRRRSFRRRRRRRSHQLAPRAARAVRQAHPGRRVHCAFERRGRRPLRADVTLPATQPPRCLSARMAVRPARASAVRRCVVPALNLNCAAPATRAQVYCDSIERMLGKRPDGRAEPGARHAPALPARPRFLLRSRPRARRPVRVGRCGARGQAGRGGARGIRGYAAGVGPQRSTTAQPRRQRRGRSQARVDLRRLPVDRAAPATLPLAPRGLDLDSVERV